eukprot:CAMPEP_0117666074 /NCGR_PEP_ID=MMETSP0804-20121206/10166_1 /TAXON_ID=1074897 /ORGANISM="Tetraselmis astigmatica, Strain CCMP880" /LENGTH=401 /DNA_ID=CAMNT_0005473563 /DNA_START=85 /DNA_END=1290 /DNA_ORIENTATION=+
MLTTRSSVAAVGGLLMILQLLSSGRAALVGYSRPWQRDRPSARASGIPETVVPQQRRTLDAEDAARRKTADEGTLRGFEEMKAWEVKHGEPFPGRSFGTPFPECLDPLPAPSTFKCTKCPEFYTTHIDKLYAARGGTGKLKGLEVGALHFRAPIPAHLLDMTYADSCDLKKLGLKYPELLVKNLTLVGAEVVVDAETLGKLEDDAFDVVIESHLLEHTRHFLQAVRSALRVLKPGGLFFVILPNMCYTFDRNRVQTSWQHVLREYMQPESVELNDYEHHREYALGRKNPKKPPPPGQPDVGRLDMLLEPSIFSIANSTYTNPMKRNYYIHYHTFTPRSVAQIFEAARFVLPYAFEIVDCSYRTFETALVIRKLDPVWHQLGRGSFMRSKLEQNQDVFDSLM